jgi:hypothetical protein
MGQTDEFAAGSWIVRQPPSKYSESCVLYAGLPTRTIGSNRAVFLERRPCFFMVGDAAARRGEDFSERSGEGSPF